jgi:hypothetical protein
MIVLGLVDKPWREPAGVRSAFLAKIQERPSDVLLYSRGLIDWTVTLILNHELCAMSCPHEAAQQETLRGK